MTEKETIKIGPVYGCAGRSRPGRIDALHATDWIMTKYGGRFPLGTFVINVAGSFLNGALMTILTERIQPHPNWRLFMIVGVLGGFTTFSSFEYETYQAVRDGARHMALLYVREVF